VKSVNEPRSSTLLFTLYMIFNGNNENKEAALNAVTDSQEKYCGVSSMLKKALPLTWEVNYNGQQIFNNRKEEVAILT